MFETYLIHQRVDPQLRRRFSLAITAAALATLASGATLWATQKMNVSRVGAPTSDFLIFSMQDLAPPPPAAPPAAPAAVAEPPPSEPPLENVLEPPDQTPSELPRPRRDAGAVLRAAGGGGHPFAAIGGDPRSVCVVGCGTGVARPVTDAVETKPPPEVDFSALTCRVCPDPSQEQLRHTGAAMLGKRGIDNRMRFCVDANGRVDAVSVAKSSGDPGVDRVLRQTVRGWRFAPMLVDGRPRRTCSTATFDIHFE